MNIQWYPGHMAKTRRLITEQLSLVDGVVEIIDARIPVSSRNPDINELTGRKPRLIVMNRADQADPGASARWEARFKSQGLAVMRADSKSGAGTGRFPAAARELLSDELRRRAERGLVGKPIKLMVVGIPNVGKSSFINRVSRRAAAAAEDRPGVTRGKQWISVSQGLELLDTPGILWPKFDDEITGLNLAFTGSVRDEVTDTEELAARLFPVLAGRYPEALRARYRISWSGLPEGYELLAASAIKRGYIVSGGEPDTERMSRAFLDEYRGGVLGRITLEWPEEA